METMTICGRHSRLDRRRSPRFAAIEHRRGSSSAVRSREVGEVGDRRGRSREVGAVGEVGARMEGSWNLPWTSRDFEIEYEVGRRARADLSDPTKSMGVASRATGVTARPLAVRSPHPGRRSRAERPGPRRISPSCASPVAHRALRSESSRGKNALRARPVGVAPPLRLRHHTATATHARRVPADAPRPLRPRGSP